MVSVELGIGLVGVFGKGSPICSLEFYGEFDVWIYGNEVLLKFVSFLVVLWTSSAYLNHHLINVGDVGMAKDSKSSN